MTPTRSFLLDNVNPLRGINAQRLIELLEMGQRGFYSRLQWLFYFVEKRDPMVRAVKRRLLSSLRGLDWNIKIPDKLEADKKEIAEKQQNDLRAAYDKVGNLRDALNFLALADLRGYSHLEKVYNGATAAPIEDLDPWTIVELRIVEQWFWAREGSYGPWLYNKDASETNRGDAIDPANFIIREVDDAADEIFAEHAIKRKVNDADWDGFLEDYGIPPMFIIGPPNVPKDREAEYQKMAEAAVSAQRGYLPNGATLESPSATGSGGAGVFAERLKYIDEQIVIAGTSGQLTVLAESGSGTLAGEAQKKAFDEIAQAIADEVSEIMQQQFDKPFLSRTHKDEPVLAYFELTKVDAEKAGKILKDAKDAADAGFAIDEQELSEKTGYTMRFVGKSGPTLNLQRPQKTQGAQPASVSEQPGSPVTQQPVAPAAPSTPVSDPEKLNTLLANTQRQLAEANAADLIPLQRALETAIADPTPEKLQTLLDQLPELQTQLGTSSADVLQRALSAALATGLTS
jgi:phage gp29-like protein